VFLCEFFSGKVGQTYTRSQNSSKIWTGQVKLIS